MTRKNESLPEWIYVFLLKRLKPKDAQGIRYTHLKRGLRNDVLEYYSRHPTIDKDINDALDYLKEYGFHTPYPYPFRDKYIAKHIKIDYDDDEMPYYTLPDDKKIYLPRLGNDEVSRLMNERLLEQDEESPHRYLTKTFDVEEGEILADVGCAEALLSLLVIDKLKRLYLFEADEVWNEALTRTFEPWKDKVMIVNKFVSNINDEHNVSLEKFFETEPSPPTFIKMDVEGAEISVLEGMGNLWNNKNTKVAVCTYHKKNDVEDIKALVESKGKSHELSDKYLLMSLEEYEPPYFRKAVMRVF